MGEAVGGILLVVFLVHLAAFSVLLFRRRQVYYVALTTTFALLSAVFALRLTGVTPEVAGMGLDRWLRYLAWVSAAVSVSWTLTRIWRRRQAGRQNCS